jgi:uncharacterized membrane protein
VTITPEIIAALFTGIVAILAGFFAFSKWVINKFLKELKPNGGSSLKDQVNRLEKRVDDIYHILAEKERHG